MKLLRFVSLREKRKERRSARSKRSWGRNQHYDEEAEEPTICIVGEEDVRLKIVDVIPDRHETTTAATTTTIPNTPSTVTPVAVTRVPSKGTQQKLFMKNLMNLSKQHIDAMGEPTAPAIRTGTLSTTITNANNDDDGNLATKSVVTHYHVPEPPVTTTPTGGAVTTGGAKEGATASASGGATAGASGGTSAGAISGASGGATGGGGSGTSAGASRGAAGGATADAKISDENNKVQREEGPSTVMPDWSSLIGPCQCQAFEFFSFDSDDEDEEQEVQHVKATADKTQTAVAAQVQVPEFYYDKDDAASIPSALKDIPIKQRFLTRTLESMSLAVRRVEYDDAFVGAFNEQMAELDTTGSNVSDLKSTITMSRLSSLADDDSMYDRLRQMHLAMREEERDESSTIAC